MWWQDVIFVAVLIAFFGLMVLFVRICERIVGHDDLDAVDGGLDPEDRDTQEQESKDQTPAEVAA